MRDGVELALDVIIPDSLESVPSILLRTPYDKALAGADPALTRLARKGYAVAIQDVRGRFNSDGRFHPYRNERDDGYDSVEWIAAQEWCSGRIGMAGRSYAGQTQWLAAAARPPHLNAIVPFCSPPDLFLNEPVLNGIFLLPVAEWMVKMGRRSFTSEPFLEELFTQHEAYLNALPLTAIPAAAGVSSDWWAEMLGHPTFDEYWREGSYQDAWHEMTVAALNVTGWWDMNFPGALQNFLGMRIAAKTDESRFAQRLVIGPWHHIVNHERILNGVDLSANALIDLDSYVLQFYERWLRDDCERLADDPSVRIFVLGANEWWAADEWPLPGAVQVQLYFHSDGGANSDGGDGVLSSIEPGDEPFDTYRYDPGDPVEAVWKLRDGPVDDSAQSSRPDVLCYTTEPLGEAVDVVGPVEVKLWAASSALDTDWHARLVDVLPNGTTRFLCHGALRARFRQSLVEPQLLEPGMPYLFTFALDATANRFLPGHRIRLELTSSWFPRYERNMNSGAENNFLASDPIVARQTVFHDRGRASHLSLWVVPGQSTDAV